MGFLYLSFRATGEIWIQTETNFSPKILELAELNFLKVRSSVFPTLAMPECFPSYSQEDPSFQEG